MYSSSLNRFVDVQSLYWNTIKAEITAGEKRTHWMWFIFPQHMILGKSETAVFYGLLSKEEAAEYSRHPVLGERLRECCTILLTHNKSAVEIFGEVDTVKLQACLTLFMVADPLNNVYKETLYKYFDVPDERTLELL